LLGAAAINVGLNLLLIPRSGIMGAAYATFVAYAAYLTMVSVAAGKSIFSNLRWQWIAKVCGAALTVYLLISVPLLEVNSELLTLVFKAALGSSAYLAVLVLLGEDEIWLLWERLRLAS
jgi:O-antigen/teichoic acid export membrane protein